MSVQGQTYSSCEEQASDWLSTNVVQGDDALETHSLAYIAPKPSMLDVRASGRNPRATRACARCRKRKIRCDLAYPTCGTCAAVGVDCMGFDATKGEEQPRSLVAFLENKVAHLEIELAKLQCHAAGDQSVEQALIPGVLSQYRSQLLASISLRNGCDRAYDAGYNTESWRSVPYISPSLLPTLDPVRDPAAVDVPTLRARAVAQRRDIASIPRNVVDIMLKHYADFYLAQYPIVDESELVEQCNRVYDRTATQFDLYVVCMALSISAHTLIRHDQERATKAADEFWETAITSLDSVLEQGPLVQLQAIMLLCHYGFANPSVVNSGLCSRAAMALCVQLGLHQEPSAVNLRRFINLESQRRIFWTCYVLDAQNNMLTGKPSSVFNVNISVRYPTLKNIETEHGVKAALANYLYAFRQLEAEITLGMLHAENCGDSRIAAPEWLNDARARAESWREMLDCHQFACRIEFRYLMYNYQRMRLNRLSPRLPNPSNAMRRECMVAGIFNASEYCRFSQQGSFFYWHFCCWHFFEIGIVLVEGTHTGLDLIWRHQESFLDPTIAVQILRLMHAIPMVLNKMLHRWPQVKQMILELERLFNPALRRLDQFVAGETVNMESSNDEAVARQVLSIRRYLLGGCDLNVRDDQERRSVSYQQVGQQVSALHSLQPPIAEESPTVEEVLHVLQPSRNDGNGMWPHPSAIENTIIDPRPMIDSNPQPDEASAAPEYACRPGQTDKQSSDFNPIQHHCLRPLSPTEAEMRSESSGAESICGNCAKAGVECVGYDAVAKRHVPRSYVHSLEERIAFLELKLQRYGIDSDSDQNEQHESITHEGPVQTIPAPESVIQPVLDAKFKDQSQSLSRMLRFETRTDEHFNKLLFAELHRTEVTLDIVQALEGQSEPTPLLPSTKYVEFHVPHNLDAAPVSLPEKRVAEHLTVVYFEFANFSSPALHEPTFRTNLELSYTYLGREPVDDLGVEKNDRKERLAVAYSFLVFAVALLTLQKHDATGVPTSLCERYYATALRSLDDIGLPADIEGIQILLLIAQYSSLHPSVFSTWKTIGMAVRLAVELGLHQEAPAGKFDPLTLDTRRRVFWVVYSMDRTVGSILNRPFCLSDGAITTQFPSPVQDDLITVEGIHDQETGAIGKKAFSLHYFRYRQLQSEIQITLHEHRPAAYPSINYTMWQQDMHRRLQEWKSSSPRPHSSAPPSNIAPPEVLNLAYHQAVITLYRSSPIIPQPSEYAMVQLAESASVFIRLYRQLHRENKLRLFWQAVYNLFAAGTALLYCYSHSPLVRQRLTLRAVEKSVHSCSAALWAMVERFPAAKGKRDAFDVISSAALEAVSNAAGDSLPRHDGSSSSVSASPPSINNETLERRRVVPAIHETRNTTHPSRRDNFMGSLPSETETGLPPPILFDQTNISGSRSSDDEINEMTVDLPWAPAGDDLSFVDLSIIRDPGNLSLSTWV
ncbi:hypothetical protein UA08_02324 [Talaromyces atroroseus]|uniref:Zn(2)-C6 fungal-type domain-containing protein n=1 Tax=Talaromyces atroroseus TaxID=1441469 RepID=A0A225B8C6_TALAT|nr:hypothetical protein UA08_02324 [Talaromyces atroroseus]OKL62197.1 hypothetical protein UA08_02324 [Talaromyces atroroseus]